MIDGEYVRLRVLDAADAERVRQWRNSPSVARGYEDRFFISDARQRQYVESLANDRTQVVFVAEIAHTGDALGVCSLRQIDYRNQRGAIGILRNPAAAGSGLEMFEAGFLLFDYGFHYLNLRKLTSEVLVGNRAAMRWNEAMGLKREGTLREHVYCDGAFQDIAVFGIFRDDFCQRPTQAVAMFLAARNTKQQ